MIPDPAGFVRNGHGLRLERGFQLSASLNLIAYQMVRKTQQRLRGHSSDWIHHLPGDVRASLSHGAHTIELACSSVENMQLSDEANLFDWIAQRLRKLQAPRERGMSFLSSTYRVRQGDSEARLQMHLDRRA